MIKGPMSEQCFSRFRDIKRITTSLFEPNKDSFDYFPSVKLDERSFEIRVKWSGLMFEFDG